MNHIVVYREIPSFLLESLKKMNTISYFDKITGENYEEFLTKLQSADGLLGTSMKITKEMLDEAPNLKVVSNFSAGYDNLDLEDLSDRGIMATNAPDALTDTTADMIFGLVLSVGRRITELDRYVRAKKWNSDITKELFGLDIHHKTIGIIGMGRIGRAVAKRAALGFDMKVLYHKRSRDLQAEVEFGATYCELHQLLQESDYVCLTVPLTPETYYLIGEEELKMMKPTGVLINGARGAVINEAALISALKAGTILAAGLDVFEKEPLSTDSELLTMENVVLLPHIGSATERTRTKMVELAIENLQQALNGERPKNLLNANVFHTKEM